MEVKGGRQFSQKELNASRAAIPKFQDPRETVAAKAKKADGVSVFFFFFLILQLKVRSKIAQNLGSESIGKHFRALFCLVKCKCSGKIQIKFN